MLRAISTLTRFPFVYRAWQAPFIRQKIQPVLDDPCYRTAERVLDVGCGPGTNAGFFSGRSYLGLDLDPEMVAAAKKAHGDKFVVGSAVDYPFHRHGLFDLILINSLFHHLSDGDAHAALDNVRAALAPGGAVHIVDLVLPREKGIPRFLAGLDRGDYPRPLEAWRPMFGGHFEEQVFRPHRLSVMGVSCYEMVYFKGIWPNRRP